MPFAGSYAARVGTYGRLVEVIRAGDPLEIVAQLPERVGEAAHVTGTIVEEIETHAGWEGGGGGRTLQATYWLWRSQRDV